MQPTITICTDASFTQEAAAWAAYIRLPKKTIKTGKAISEKVQDPTKAERIGISCALFIAAREVDLSKYRLILYCDNIGALSKPELKVTPKSRHYTRQKAKYVWYKAHIEPYLKKAQSVETRHVRGHLKKRHWHQTSKRNYMNKWCDKHAGELRRAEEKRLKESALEKLKLSTEVNLKNP